MRANNTLCLALGAAQLAACAATPRQSMALVADAPDAAHVRGGGGGVATTPKDRNGGAPAARDRPDHHAASPWQRPARPLAKHRIPGQGQGPQQIEIIRARPSPEVDDEDDSEVLDVTYATPPQPGIPYPRRRPAQERNDMLVVFLAIAFVLAVVVMETWESVFGRRGGAIRLEQTRQNQSPVSIQASPDEKDHDGGGMSRRV